MLILSGFVVTWFVIGLCVLFLKGRIKDAQYFEYYTSVFEQKIFSNARYESLTKDIVKLKFILSNFDRYTRYKTKLNNGGQTDLTDTEIIRLIKDDLYKEKIQER